jgi:tetratricopeptide (TPR) repeat protein
MALFLRSVVWSVTLVAAGWFLSAAALAQPSSADTSPEEARERLAADRFLALLEKQPRFGTALDKVYAFHIERGTLDDFLAAQRQKTSNPQQAGAAWMVIGLVEFQRGRDALAVAAFREAEKLRTEDALASYYLGRSLLLVGKTDEATQAYERALDRKPARVDSLEIFQALGQLYQRARKTEQALKVWDKFEQAFPEDLRVQEHIAGILADEGDHAGALARFEKLATKATDPYRKVQYQLRVGELKLKLGRTEEALSNLEQLLGQLKPDSWLHRDVRQRIEATFLRTDDYDGLAKYYESWITKHPDDLDAMSRLGHVLGLQGRRPEAETWYRKALAVAPSNKSLRRALIDQLVQANKFREAAAEYAELDRLEPNHPDTLRAWGQLVLEDKSRPDAERKQQAAEVWKKLLAAKPKDALITSQVADLLRQARLTDEAVALYQQAIALAPNEPQYREYLGEYLHSLERGPEAVAVWKEIATGDKRNTRNLVRLAEVYRGFGYRTEAVAAMGEACALDPEFADIVRYAEMLRDAAEYDQALAQLDRAGKLAENDDERGHVLNERIRTYVDAGTLGEQTASLEKAVEPNGTAEQWRTLALMYEAARRSNDAGRAIAKALEADDKSLPTWIVAARLYESSGLFAQAVEANQKLAALDRRARTDYLQRIATLNMRLGKINDALQAGQEVIAAAPGNPEHYQFYAQLCFQVGKTNDGLDALRRAVRVNPTDLKALLTLASALGEQFRTDEAIELYWRGFDVAEDLEGRTTIVASLTELYLRTNHLDRLIAKLTRIGEERKNEREAALWLAAAHQAAGDVGTARETLAVLLTEDSKDTQLLTQLVRLAETEFDIDQAVAYQRRINELAPSREGQHQLATLLLRSGATDDAEALWLELAATNKEPHKVYDAIDELIKNERYSAALKLAERLLRDNPQDWEALFRAGLAHWKSSQPDEALAKLEQLRGLSLPHDRPSAKSEFIKAQAQKRGAAATTPGTAVLRSSPYPANYPPALMRSSISYQIQQAFDLDSSRYGYSSRFGTWSPADFGQARLAAPILRLMQSANSGKAQDAVAELQQKLTRDDLSTDELWETYALFGVAQRYVPSDQRTQQQWLSQVTRKLSERDDPGAKLLYLTSFRSRQVRTVVNGVVTMQPAEPLSAEELDHAVKCYEVVQAAYPDWVDNYGLTAAIAQELKAGKREDAAEALYKSAVDRANDVRSLQAAVQLASALGKTDDLIALVARQEEQLKTQSAQTGPSASSIWLRVASAFVEKEDWARVREVVGRAIDARAAEMVAQPKQRRYASARSTGPVRVTVPIAGTTNYRSATIDYPQPSAYFDQTLISQLYSLFELLKTKQQSAELIALMAQKGQASGDSQLLCRLAHTFFLHWSDQKDEAAARLREAAEAAPEDPALRLQFAEMMLKARRPQEALDAVEAFEPTEHTVLRDRELIALQAAVNLGEVERARRAAERLAGMQLEAPLQFQLSQLMQQLGMHEQAENVLARLRRRSGNQTNTLVQLMQQYLAQGNQEVASQIAQQLLRRSKPSSLPSNYVTEDSNARQQALQTLNRTGQLAKILARLEAQLEKSPNSLFLLESLAEYYRAAGQDDKAQAVLNKLSEQQPKDARALYQVGEQLYRARKYSEACDVYLQAIKKDPARLEDRYYDIQRAFQQAKRTPDLAAVFQEIDLKAMGRYSYRVIDIVSELMQQKETREAGLALFRRAWEAFPDQRTQLVGRIYQDELWDTDEIYNYARQAVIPTKGAIGDPWRGIADIISYSGDGRVTGLLTRLTQATKRPERRDQMAREVAAALKDSPDWKGGEAILAVLEAKAGNTESAQQRVDKLIKDGNVPGRAAMVLGQEIGDVKALQSQAVQLLEVANTSNDGMMDQFSYHPGRSLARLYAQTGERAKARQTILDLLGRSDYSRYGTSNPGYAEYQELQNLQAAAQDFLKMEMPLEALRLYQRATSDPSKFTAASRWGGTYLQQEVTRGQEAAQKALTPQALSSALGEWIRPPGATKEKDKPQPPAVEFALAVQPQSLDSAAVVSLFETALLSAAGKGTITAAVTPPPTAPTNQSPLQSAFSGFAASAKRAVSTAIMPAARQAETLDKLREQLAATSKDADDLSLRTATALVEVIDVLPDRTSAATAALDRLRESVAKELPPEAGAVATPTEPQLAIWLVARHALKHPEESVQAAGRDLADRSLQTARRHPDRVWLLAMLREQGQSALDAGDKTAAQKLWTEMLDEVLRVEGDGKVKPAAAAAPARAGGF